MGSTRASLTNVCLNVDLHAKLAVALVKQELLSSPNQRDDWLCQQVIVCTWASLGNFRYGNLKPQQK